LDLENGLSFHAGTSQYSISVGDPAHSAIRNDDNWTITDGGQITAASVTLTDGSAYTPPGGSPNTADNPIGRLEVTADQTGATIPALIVQLSGTNTGVERIKVWSSSDPTFDTGTAQELASLGLDPSTNTPPSVLLDGFSQSIPTSTLYLYLTVDLTSNATGDVDGSLAEGPDLVRDEGVLTNSAGEFPLPLSSGSTTLPVELASFSGTAHETGVRLTW
jgi:hypothetical protein